MVAFSEFPMEHIAEGIRKAREYRGIRQTETAELIGISPNTLQHFETGKFSPSLPMLESLSFIHQAPPRALFSPEAINKCISQPDAGKLQHSITIRHKIISANLQIAFKASPLTEKELSKAAGISSSKIKRYLDREEITIDDL